MRVFIECVVDANYKGLVITGTPTDDVIASAWEEISAQYMEELGTSEQQLHVSLFKQVGRLQTTLAQVELLVQYLKDVYVKQFADEVNRLLHTSFEFDPSSPQYDKEIKRAKARTKEMQLQLQAKTAQLEAVSKKIAQEGEPPTRKYFLTVLTALSNHCGYRLSLADNEFTVYEFIDRMKRMIAEKEARIKR